MPAVFSDFGMAKAVQKARVTEQPDTRPDFNRATERRPTERVSRSTVRRSIELKAPSKTRYMTSCCGTPQVIRAYGDTEVTSLIELIALWQYMAPELCVNEVAVLDAWNDVNGKSGESRDVAVKKSREFSAMHATVEYGMMVDVCEFDLLTTAMA